MGAKIHPTAIIDPSAELADDVKVDAYATVGPDCRIGAGTYIRSHAQVIKRTTVGRECDIHPGAVVGGDPQDLKFRGEDTELIVGDNNTIRECATVNRGTGLGGGKTVIGNGNLIMAYAHIAHDCIIDNQAIITNGAQLAGHIKVEDRAIISGMVGVHHFVTIGTGSFIAGFSAVRNDVPPYMIVDGNPARVRKLNLEGCRRQGISDAGIKGLKDAFRLVYRSDLTRAEAMNRIQAIDAAGEDAVQNLLRHYRDSEAGYQGRALEASRKDKEMPCGKAKA